MSSADDTVRIRKPKQYLSVGMRIGSREVLALERHEKNKKWWRVRCDCGDESVRESSAITTRGHSCKKCSDIKLSATMKAKGTLEPGKSGFRALLSTYKHSAKSRSLVWDLTEDRFKDLTQQNCTYCGIEPKQIHNSYWKGISKEKLGFDAYKYNGLDRIDSARGYTLDNVSPCCVMCNFAKRDHSREVFYEWARRVAKLSEGK